jgi:hypothetical protein
MNNEEASNQTGDTVKAFAIFIVLFVLLGCVFCITGVFSERLVPTLVIATAAQQTTGEDDKNTREEWILKVLVVREWAPDGATVESVASDIESLQEQDEGSERKRPVPPDNVEAPCAMGSSDDECQSFSEKEAGCAICLSEFQGHQLVCESNNVLCQHVFHKDCMLEWLTTKQRDCCPMCRETYLLKTV